MSNSIWTEVEIAFETVTTAGGHRLFSVRDREILDISDQDILALVRNLDEQPERLLEGEDIQLDI